VFCPVGPGRECVFEEIDEPHGQRRFIGFDPERNQSHELFRLPLPVTYWDISPDGARLAFLQGSPKNGQFVQIRRLNGQVEKEFKVKGWNDLVCLNWSADGKSIFVGGVLSGSVTLLRSDLSGNPQVLWTEPGARRIWAVPSPDGRYIAVHHERFGRNVWMLENF
jgi:hypothetical protein